uniref:Uncharacterized protein n=1 Tax=Eucampia antarctica TaxID=49252 RepID=A0A7S2RMH3_9STRA|mmetsp:Transcript_24195/g.23240  ORF Transcript_24195/g.23240 Transcript_24195/m.23240 type:complete len:157 (+) Transcript_24195:95-565(+)
MTSLKDYIKSDNSRQTIQFSSDDKDDEYSFDDYGYGNDINEFHENEYNYDDAADDLSPDDQSGLKFYIEKKAYCQKLSDAGSLDHEDLDKICYSDDEDTPERDSQVQHAKEGKLQTQNSSPTNIVIKAKKLTNDYFTQTKTRRNRDLNLSLSLIHE